MPETSPVVNADPSVGAIQQLLDMAQDLSYGDPSEVVICIEWQYRDIWPDLKAAFPSLTFIFSPSLNFGYWFLQCTAGRVVAWAP